MSAKSTSPTAGELRLRGSIAAHERWARVTDRAAETAPARAALDKKFLDQADGDPVRADHLRKAYFKRLALKSAKSRPREGQHPVKCPCGSLRREGRPLCNLHMTKTDQQLVRRYFNRAKRLRKNPEDPDALRALEQVISDMRVGVEVQMR